MTIIQNSIQDVSRTVYKHKKRGTSYTIVAEGGLQVSGPIEGLDGCTVVIYQDVNDPTKIWVRPKDEFFDPDRFEEVLPK